MCPWFTWLTLCNSKKLKQAKKSLTKKIWWNSVYLSLMFVPLLKFQLQKVMIKSRSDTWQNKMWLVLQSKNPGTKLALISCDYAWEAFKWHTVALEDQTMPDRINCLIDFAVDNPYALEITNAGWNMCITMYQRMSEDDKVPYLHNVTLHEAHFDHIRAVIIEEH